MYPSARRRKMKNFHGFYRVAAIIQPDDLELQRRSEKRTVEDGMYRFCEYIVNSYLSLLSMYGVD